DRSAAAWSKNPRVLAGRLRRAQAFLRVLGIDVAFGREGRAGTRVIRIHTRAENTVSTIGTVSSVRHNNGLCQPPGDERRRAAVTAADDADGADAKLPSFWVTCAS